MKVQEEVKINCGSGWGDFSCQNMVMFLVHVVSKSISEFDKEIIQSYTSDQPTAP